MAVLKTDIKDVIGECLDFFCIEKSKYNYKQFRYCADLWNISDSELEDAIEKIGRSHRTDLKSVRKLLGIYIYEWMKAFDSCTDIRIHYNVPGTISYMYWIKEMLGDKVYAGSPDFISMVVLYGIFNRHMKIEVGSCRHCAVNRMRNLIAEEGKNKEPDIRVTFGFTCDEAPKQDAAIAMNEKSSYICIANPIRGTESADYVAGSIESIKKTVVMTAERKGIAVNGEAKYSSAKSSRFRIATLVARIIDMVSSRGEFLLTNNDIVFVQTLLITSFHCGLENIEIVLKEMIQEMKETTGKKVRGRFCIYYTPICNPEYGNIMEKYGIALLDHTAFSSRALYTGEKNPEKDAAMEGVQMLIAGSAVDEGYRISEIIRRNDLDGFISGMFSFDRWMGMQQHQLAKIIEERTGKTVFIYDTDFWNQESFSRDRMETAVETLSLILEDSINEKNCNGNRKSVS